MPGKQALAHTLPMPFDERDLDRIVTLPSLNAVMYQAEFVIKRLSSVDGPRYPSETHRVRDVLLCIAERILRELREIYDPGKLRGIRGGRGNALRVRDLAGRLRQLFAWLRYLQATSVKLSPPTLQRAISEMAQRYLGRNGGNVACLVRPKWNYNFSHLPLQNEIDGMIETLVFDPQGKISGSNVAERFQRVWDQWRSELPPARRERTDGKPPVTIAVIAFAGLDSEDVLLWPLLVHELAHAISQGSHREHLEKILRDLKMDESLPPNEQEQVRDLKTVHIKELLADAIAVRLMGFSYFCAQAECLKRVSDWDGELVEESDHPSIGVRLKKIFSHLQEHVGQPTLRQFLADRDHPDSQELLRYLSKWEQHISSLKVPRMDSNEVITTVAKEIIPQDESATLSEGFFARIALLRRDRPPRLDGDTSHSFAEIMSAAWAYQLLTGERKEVRVRKRKPHPQRAEYTRFCNLVLQACDVEGSSSSSPRETRPQSRQSPRTLAARL